MFKINGGTINAYINQFYTLQNLQQDPPTNGAASGYVSSKHIFIGSSRIASQVVNPKSDHQFDLGQGDGDGVGRGHENNGDGHEHSWQWGNDENDWNHFCEHQDKNGNHEGDDNQIQFVTATFYPPARPRYTGNNRPNRRYWERYRNARRRPWMN